MASGAEHLTRPLGTALLGHPLVVDLHCKLLERQPRQVSRLDIVNSVKITGFDALNVSRFEKVGHQLGREGTLVTAPAPIAHEDLVVPINCPAPLDARCKPLPHSSKFAG